MISSLATTRVPDSHHSGPFRRGQPRLIVVHDVECPLRRGQAKFRMGLLAARDDASAHYLVDPGVIAASIDESLIAWGAGNVNSAAIHIEFVGYAAYTRAQWTTADGLAMLALGGELIADVAERKGIPLRWLTDAELLAAYRGTGPGGLTTHAQCSRVLGGTTHHDPGAGFPLDLLLGYATKKPTVQEDDDMELTDKVTGIRDPLATPIDQTYTVAQVYQKQVNYLGSLVNKMTRLEEKVDALAASIKSA